VADPVRYPACRRFSRTAGVNLRNGMPFYQAAKGSVSALTCFHRFTREMGSRHAAFASKSPSNPFAPISCIEVGHDDYKGGAAGSQFARHPGHNTGKMLMAESATVLKSLNYECFDMRSLNRFNKIAVMSQKKALPSLSIRRGSTLWPFASGQAAIPLQEVPENLCLERAL
jgi:hypothetical protein